MLSTIILAAGQGKRMNSELAKVLHLLYGKPLLSYVVATAKAAGSQDISVIVGHQADAVLEAFRDQGLTFIKQDALLGTGHAVLQAREKFEHYTGVVLILCGDVPLLQPVTVRSLFSKHSAENNEVTVLTTRMTHPVGYGRIVTGTEGQVLRIVEERDATVAEREINEVNTGIYCVNSKYLFDALTLTKNNNAQQEYYLTDIIAVAREHGYGVGRLMAADQREVMGINTLPELELAHQYLKEMRDGTGFLDADR